MDKSDLTWLSTARRRRILLLALIAVPTCIATGYMAHVLPHRGSTPIEMAVVAVFAILYTWISIGFWTAMAGWAVLMRSTVRFAVSNLAEGTAPIPEDARTAIVMPVYNEDVARVFAGICAIYDSLGKSGQRRRFDIFILSDPGDPDIWIEEETAWAALQSRLESDGCRIYYRQRAGNIKRKSGNVADFCRRWGKHYRYMAVLDADSIMDGTVLVRMVRIMEARPAIGILQTVPKPVEKTTPIARIQQFAGHLYGPMFAAGLNFWQLGDSQFWGHNAVIRVEPFMRFCALPTLSGKPPLGGEILSHDFVEAALMRRAGYEVWLAYDLPGSYEEPPPTLLDELKRDRRWCQGNLQHMRLLFTKGLYGAHRALFLNGVMSYGSALLWFLFLMASSAMAILQEVREPDYFPSGRSLFPSWPVWEPQWALVLMASTAFLLFLPKVCSLFHVWARARRAHLFGGGFRLVVSLLLEVIVSTLLAPTRMLFHAKFVFMTLLGRRISWEAQQRKDEGTSWAEAIRFHWGGTVFAVIWGGTLFIINRAFFWWLSPIVISLIVAVPLSVWLSRRHMGEKIRKYGLFLIPDEVAPPDELRFLRSEISHSKTRISRSKSFEINGFTRAVVDPKILSVHAALFRKIKKPPHGIAEELDAICEKAVRSGPQALNSREKRQILLHPPSMAVLHRKVWALSDEDLIRMWGLG